LEHPYGPYYYITTSAWRRGGKRHGRRKKRREGGKEGMREGRGEASLPVKKECASTTPFGIEL